MLTDRDLLFVVTVPGRVRSRVVVVGLGEHNDEQKLNICDDTEQKILLIVEQVNAEKTSRSQ